MTINIESSDYGPGPVVHRFTDPEEAIRFIREASLKEAVEKAGGNCEVLRFPDGAILDGDDVA